MRICTAADELAPPCPNCNSQQPHVQSFWVIKPGSHEKIMVTICGNCMWGGNVTPYTPGNGLIPDHVMPWYRVLLRMAPSDPLQVIGKDPTAIDRIELKILVESVYEMGYLDALQNNQSAQLQNVNEPKEPS